ncbi:MAG: ROK family protein [Bdellovibrionota bacterium]
MHQSYWGIDLGGTKIEGVVLTSLDNPEPLCRLRVDTNAHLGYEHIVTQAAELLAAMRQETGLTPERVGVGHPGVLDPRTKLLKNSNTQCLNGKPFQRDFESKIGIPAMLANDANCFALAEACYGAARNASVVFGVIMGTGVGGGIVLSRKVHSGAQGIAGEWGHNVLDPTGPECYCGKRGCVEAMISGPALEKLYFDRTNRKAPLSEIVSLAESGQEQAAADVLDHLTTWFGRAITVVINILDPDCVVIGGGVSNIDALYTRGVAEAARTTFNDSLSTPIVKNLLGDSAGVFGAAMLT